MYIELSEQGIQTSQQKSCSNLCFETKASLWDVAVLPRRAGTPHVVQVQSLFISETEIHSSHFSKTAQPQGSCGMKYCPRSSTSMFVYAKWKEGTIPFWEIPGYKSTLFFSSFSDLYKQA